ncbi:hypothetical protein EV426DRAFT_595148 [Tirmania nivea]|nr:hypothetical protein EV426DRAFT_595148 [Tirmania nivea]
MSSEENTFRLANNAPGSSTETATTSLFGVTAANITWGDVPSEIAILPRRASSPGPEPLVKTADIKIDPHGDITLVIATSSGTARFQVNSGVLCVASPVIRAMLGPDSSFKEARDLAASSRSQTKARAPLEVRLEDDDPQAMAIILRILHLQFDLVPIERARVDEVKLYQMAIICDKYDMQRALGYWFKHWTAEALDVTGPKWLFMAYAFGHETIFTEVSRDLMVRCEVTGDGDLILPGVKNPIFDDIFVPEIVVGRGLQGLVFLSGTDFSSVFCNTDAIAASRLQAIEEILDHIHQQIEYYYPNANGGITPVRCPHNRAQHTCDALTLGLLLREVQKLNVYPTLSPEIACKSVTSLVQLLNGLAFPQSILITQSSDGCCAVPNFAECHSGGSYCLRCVTCVNCNRRYKPAMIGTRHDGECSPMRRLKRGLEEIVDRVKGVDFGIFARDTKGKDNDSKPSDLWNSVEFA